MLMSVWGGENHVTEAATDVEPIAPGIGQIICPECGGDQGRYRKLFPEEIACVAVWTAKAPGLSS